METIFLFIIFSPLIFDLIVINTSLRNRPGFRLAAAILYFLLAAAIIYGVLTNPFSIWPVLIVFTCVFGGLNHFDKFRELRAEAKK